MEAQESAAGSAIVDLSTLQLEDFVSARLRMEDLFLEWITAENTQRMIDVLLEDANCKAAVASTPPVVPEINTARRDVLASSSARGVARKSPKKRTQAEMGSAVTNPQEQHRAKNPSHHKEPAQSEQPQNQPVVVASGSTLGIPRFYTPGERKAAKRSALERDSSLFNRTLAVQKHFDSFPNGVPVQDFVHITKRVCGFPSFFNFPLCQRIAELFDPQQPRHSREHLTVSLSAFMEYWKTELESYDNAERFFRLVKRPDAKAIAKDDFVPFIQELLHFHPGLDFLENHEDFQRKYALTVITRIFYTVNTSRTGYLSLRELRRSNLVAEFTHVDEEEDINKVTSYFSYEHFYVMYCRFYELDADNDARLTREDLLKYADHALSETIVDRVFKVGMRAFSDGEQGGFEAEGMTYPDFIYFMLSEEDKGNQASLRYWFNCLDLDGDGVLAVEDMQYFYRAQLHRLTSLGHEPVLFEDVLCQMMDLLEPPNPHAVTISDFVRPDKIAHSGNTSVSDDSQQVEEHLSQQASLVLEIGLLFDVLFNLHKFMRFEMRDPFAEKQKREDPFDTDWDRFAYYEYHRLALEEEGDGEDSAPEMEVEVFSSAATSFNADYSDMDSPGSFAGVDNKSSGWLVEDSSDDELVEEDEQQVAFPRADLNFRR